MKSKQVTDSNKKYLQMFGCTYILATMKEKICKKHTKGITNLFLVIGWVFMTKPYFPNVHTLVSGTVSIEATWQKV